jgi:hypothetical protein
MIRTLLVVSAMLLSSVAYAQEDNEDYVVGSGTAGSGSFEVDVHSGPDGENAHGIMNYAGILGDLFGTATFLCVDGDKAVVAGTFAPNPHGTAFTGFFFHVWDRAALGLADVIRLEIVGYVPAGCVDYNMVSGALVKTGDIVIYDAKSMPTFSSVTALTMEYVIGSGVPGASGIANSLCVILAAAERAQQREDLEAKAGGLQAFVNEVAALENAGTLTADQAATLTSQAMML